MKEKRAYTRKSVDIRANIIYKDELYTGMLMNVSKNGAYIETGSELSMKLKYKIFFHLKPKFIILFRSDSESIKLHAKTRRWFKIDRYYNGIGVKVLSPSLSYYNFINSH